MSRPAALLSMRLTYTWHRAIIGPVINSKQDVLNELSSAREALMAAIEGLTPEQMRMPGVTGIWSVKDVLAHIAAWESELVTALNQAQNRRVPPIIDIEDIDEWNEEVYHLSARRPLEAVLSDLAGVHKMLLKMVGDYNERALTDNRRYPWMEGEPLWYLVEENAYLHEREHAEEILAWRERTGT
jgi:uncharacterized damage-inducible protein DinB